MPPPKALVWRYFTADDRQDGKKSATCNVCHKSISVCQSSTSAIRAHLKRLHRDLYNKLVADETDLKTQNDEAIRQTQLVEAAAGKVVKHGNVILFLKLVVHFYVLF